MSARPTVPGFTTARGAVLIIVLWVCLGVVALTLYFANEMSAELRAADNRAADIAARQAVAGGERYASYVLSTYASNGTVPVLNAADSDCPYSAENLPVGEANFWFVGRDANLTATSAPVFGLVDESSKLNLNTATRAMLEALPNMTSDLATAILAWRSRTSGTTTTGDAYAALNPPRTNKGAAFESVDELRLVYGMTLELLLGEDTNRNGALDRNEDDGESSPPRDDQDGQLLPGLLEYLTIYSVQPNTNPDGTSRINITSASTRTGLATRLTQRLGSARSAAVITKIGTTTFTSVAAFYVQSGLTASEFAQVHTDLTASSSNARGLVNVNTASATVLACLPGLSATSAAQIVAYRAANPSALTSFAWLPTVIGSAAFIQAGPYITDQSYQFSADVVAVGRTGRGYCRERVVFDLRGSSPRIVNRQDLGGYGWALGSTVRQNLKANPLSTTSS